MKTILSSLAIIPVLLLGACASHHDVAPVSTTTTSTETHEVQAVQPAATTTTTQEVHSY